jgi:hypothetical protein
MIPKVVLFDQINGVGCEMPGCCNDQDIDTRGLPVLDLFLEKSDVTRRHGAHSANACTEQ